MITLFKDYYEILEVSPNASPEVIEKAYKVLMMKYHPDHNVIELKASEQKSKDLNEARQILVDTKSRKLYDAEYNKNKKESVITEDYKRVIDDYTIIHAEEPEETYYIPEDDFRVKKERINPFATLLTIFSIIPAPVYFYLAIILLAVLMDMFLR